MIHLHAKSCCLLAVIGALALAGCGVKGPIEPPPAAGVAPVPQPEPTNTALAPAPTADPLPGPAPSVTTRQGPPRTSASVQNAPAARQRSALDWLID